MKDYNSHKNYFVFDVDRTIINSTSWFYACTCPALLIPKKEIGQFMRWNETLFNGKTYEQKKEFRNKTLSIIEKRVTEPFIKLIENIPLFKDMFSIGEDISTLTFYAAGYYTLQYLVKVDDNVIDFIKFSKRFFCDDYKVIFLSSGYQPFMRGIVDALQNSVFNDSLDYEVIGSELTIDHGNIKEIFYMSQHCKYEYIKKMQDEGKHIVFLADDSLEEPKLQEVVIEKGGMYFRPMLDCSTRKLNWDTITKKITEKNIKTNLMYSNHKCSLLLDECHSNEFVKWLENHNNKIGIIMLNQNEFDHAFKFITNNLSDKTVEEKLQKLLQNFIYKADDIVYLRSTMYYYWMPSYIIWDSSSNQKKWMKLMNYTQKLFCLIVDIGYFKYSQEQCPNEVRAILYLVLDYLFECALFLLNILEKESIKSKSINNEHYISKVTCLCQKISHMFVGLFERINISDIALEIRDHLLPQINLETLPDFNNIDHYMRELDDNILVYKSALSVARSLIINNINLTHVISFPYGGIALGFFLNSILIQIFKLKNNPNLINCHFSSKLKIRQKINLELVTIFDFIPGFYKEEIQNIKMGNASILLYDNNATTFSTICIAKQQLMEFGNNVFGATVSVNYDNICNYLFANNKFEVLDKHWQNALDFQPISEYITAFDTWGTSQKTRLLEKIFFTSFKRDMPINIKEVNFLNANFIYKVCRVHNMFDLEKIIKAGASMIGIHAVYHDKINYYLSESQYAPNFSMKFNTPLPVANFEVKSIRKMIENLPEHIQPVLVIEQLLEIDMIKRCCDVYGLKTSNIFLQLQCRVTPKDILKIKKNINRNIISIGAFQHDFTGYFWDIHNTLNPNTDYILLDISKHQPDIISGNASEEHNFKVEILKKISYEMSGNKIPLLIADDTTPEQMQEYIKILEQARVYYKGIDMQNNTELEKEKQKYTVIIEEQDSYLIRIRKSMQKLEKWRRFVLSKIT